MVAQPKRLHAKKAGGQCPFPYPSNRHGLSLKAQLYEIADTLKPDDLAQLLVFLAGASDQMPKALNMQDRLFLKVVKDSQRERLC